MTPRFKSLEMAGKRYPILNRDRGVTCGEIFGSHVFNRSVMERMLRQDVCKNAIAALEGYEQLNPDFANEIATAMKEWAISLGATHYTHWFQPLTGATAEKHDSFIEWTTPGKVIERFGGKQLIQGEPDASSFPSGGLRSTFEARGYTGWDPSSPAFIWRAGDGVTLCIPSIFFSWTGAVLDHKIPLLRSDKLINDVTLRLLHLTGTKCQQVYSTLGWEQEYFVVDRALRNLRPDLLISGQTVYGAPPPKGQELQDHYFGTVQDRIVSYMDDFERQALYMGIPVKTRHNEVAPGQHEVAPVFEKASVSVDHNILLMELMRKVAANHELACLLDEKPFAGLNGSGKHNNWSLATDTGINLLDPKEAIDSPVRFLILLTAVLNAVHEHADLLLASIASASNDNRLGGHEAPPAIISVYLGNALEQYVTGIEKGEHEDIKSVKGTYDFGIPALPDLTRDDTDRNRTSPFAFTGQKFEFRAVGSSASCAWPITVLNVVVARSLNAMLDEVEKNLSGKRSPGKRALAQAALPVIRKYLKRSRNIRYTGDNYDSCWHAEAAKRKLPIIANAPEAYHALLGNKVNKTFEGIFTKAELESRYDIFNEAYANQWNIKTNLMIEIFRTQILPASFEYQTKLAGGLAALAQASGTQKPKAQYSVLQNLAKTIDAAIDMIDKLEVAHAQAEKKTDNIQRATAYATKVSPIAVQARALVDELEMIVDDRLWPLPKTRELLFVK